LPFENEQRALGKDGKYRWFLNRYNPEYDEHGNILRWYVTGTDIDDRKQAEERIRNENLALREQIDRDSTCFERRRLVILDFDKSLPPVRDLACLGI
jgi:formate hydrogenlyase transcriptional activator